MIAIAGVGVPAAAQESRELTAEEILKNVYLLGDAPNIVLSASMDIKSPRGDKTRVLDIYISQNDDESKILAQVSSPAFLRNLKFLTHQFTDGSDDKWVKTSRGVRRLAEGNYGEALFDSDFTVEDLSRINQSRFNLELADSSEFPGMRAVKATPTYRNPDYTHKVFLIEVETGMLAGVNFFIGEGLIKRYTLVERQLVDGELYPLICLMEDLSEDTSTIFEIIEVSIEDSIPARLFNRGSL
jgi:hypothetical protein